MSREPVLIRYFAWVRERIGLAEERLALPETVVTAGDLVGWLSGRGEAYAFAWPVLDAGAAKQFEDPLLIARRHPAAIVFDLEHRVTALSIHRCAPRRRLRSSRW